jgi:hypothetical protein
MSGNEVLPHLSQMVGVRQAFLCLLGDFIKFWQVRWPSRLRQHLLTFNFVLVPNHGLRDWVLSFLRPTPKIVEIPGHWILIVRVFHYHTLLILHHIAFLSWLLLRLSSGNLTQCETSLRQTAATIQIGPWTTVRHVVDQGTIRYQIILEHFLDIFDSRSDLWQPRKFPFLLIKLLSNLFNICDRWLVLLGELRLE